MGDECKVERQWVTFLPVKNSHLGIGATRETHTFQLVVLVASRSIIPVFQA
jgi:hypothetical protein